MPFQPYTLIENRRPTLGLIVLQVDETVEGDMRRMLPVDGIALHVSRIPSGQELNPDTIAQMEIDLPAAARLLPPAAQFDVVGYACTSGTTLIGAERVAQRVQRGARAEAVTDPLTAALAACATLGVARLGIVSPYVDAVAEPVRTAFVAAGIAVPCTSSFGEEIEERVARIALSSIAAAATDLAGRENLDAIFLSCTNLRTLDLIAPLEADLGIPILSSNQVLGWHMGVLSGQTDAMRVPGALASKTTR